MKNMLQLDKKALKNCASHSTYTRHQTIADCFDISFTSSNESIPVSPLLVKCLFEKLPEVYTGILRREEVYYQATRLIFLNIYRGLKYSDALLTDSREQGLQKLSNAYNRKMGDRLEIFRLVNPTLAKDSPIYHHPIFSDLLLAWTVCGDDESAKRVTVYYLEQIKQLNPIKEVQAFIHLIRTMSPEQKKDLEQLLNGTKITGILFWESKICSNSPYNLNQFLEVFKDVFGRNIDFSLPKRAGKASTRHNQSGSNFFSTINDAMKRGVPAGDGGFNGLRELGGDIVEGIENITSQIPTDVKVELSTEGIKVSASKQNFLAKITPLHLSIAQTGISCLGLVSGSGAVLATLGSLAGLIYTGSFACLSNNFTQKIEGPGYKMTGKELLITSYTANIASSALGLCMFTLGGRALPAVCSTAVLGVSFYKYAQAKGEVFGISFS